LEWVLEVNRGIEGFGNLGEIMEEEGDESLSMTFIFTIKGHEGVLGVGDGGAVLNFMVGKEEVEARFQAWKTSWEAEDEVGEVKAFVGGEPLSGEFEKFSDKAFPSEE
jgi:hypothetical protein